MSGALPTCHRGIFLAMLLGAVSLIAAEKQTPLDVATAQTREDIVQAREDLAEVYEITAEQKAELVQACETLADEIDTLQEHDEQVVAENAARRRQIEDDRRSTEHLQELSRYLGNMALEYRRGFEARLSSAQAETVQQDLAAVDQALSDDLDALTPDVLGKVLEVSASRCEQALGGERFPGEALDVEGLAMRGTYITFGPVTFFSQGPDEVTGLAVQQVGSMTPTVFAGFQDEETAALRQLFASGQARVPVDVTMGSGVRLRETRETVLSHLRKGGIIMIPLLLLGVVCVLIVCAKVAVVMRLPTAASQGLVLDIVDAVNRGDIDRAETLAGTLRKPLRAVIGEGLEHRNASKEHLEEILYEQVLAQIPVLERFLSPLAVCASAAPLLGLLGTVTGMIHTFQLITVFGTGDARLLSAGISEALITTEVGLMIAIPALLFHAYLSRRVRLTVGMAQEVSLSFVNGIKLKGEGAS